MDTRSPGGENERSSLDNNYTQVNFNLYNLNEYKIVCFTKTILSCEAPSLLQNPLYSSRACFAIFSEFFLLIFSNVNNRNTS